MSDAEPDLRGGLHFFKVVEARPYNSLATGVLPVKLTFLTFLF